MHMGKSASIPVAIKHQQRMGFRLWAFEKWVNFGSHTHLLERVPSSRTFRHAVLVAAMMVASWAGEVIVDHIKHSGNAMEGKHSQPTQERMPQPKTEGIRK